MNKVKRVFVVPAAPNGLDPFCFYQRNEGLAPPECFPNPEVL